MATIKGVESRSFELSTPSVDSSVAMVVYGALAQLDHFLQLPDKFHQPFAYTPIAEGDSPYPALIADYFRLRVDRFDRLVAGLKTPPYSDAIRQIWDYPTRIATIGRRDNLTEPLVSDVLRARDETMKMVDAYAENGPLALYHVIALLLADPTRGGTLPPMEKPNTTTRFFLETEMLKLKKERNADEILQVVNIFIHRLNQLGTSDPEESLRLGHLAAQLLSPHAYLLDAEIVKKTLDVTDPMVLEDFGNGRIPEILYEEATEFRSQRDQDPEVNEAYAIFDELSRALGSSQRIALVTHNKIVNRPVNYAAYAPEHIRQTAMAIKQLEYILLEVFPAMNPQMQSYAFFEATSLYLALQSTEPLHKISAYREILAKSKKTLLSKAHQILRTCATGESPYDVFRFVERTKGLLKPEDINTLVTLSTALWHRVGGAKQPLPGGFRKTVKTLAQVHEDAGVEAIYFFRDTIYAHFRNISANGIPWAEKKALADDVVKILTGRNMVPYKLCAKTKEAFARYHHIDVIKSEVVAIVDVLTNNIITLLQSPTLKQNSQLQTSLKAFETIFDQVLGDPYILILLENKAECYRQQILQAHRSAAVTQGVTRFVATETI